MPADTQRWERLSSASTLQTVHIMNPHRPSSVEDPYSLPNGGKALPSSLPRNIANTGGVHVRYLPSRKDSLNVDVPCDLAHSDSNSRRSTYARLEDLVCGRSTSTSASQAPPVPPMDDEDSQDLEIAFKPLPLKAPYHSTGERHHHAHHKNYEKEAMNPAEYPKPLPSKVMELPDDWSSTASESDSNEFDVEPEASDRPRSVCVAEQPLHHEGEKSSCLNERQPQLDPHEQPLKSNPQQAAVHEPHEMRHLRAKTIALPVKGSRTGQPNRPSYPPNNQKFPTQPISVASKPLNPEQEAFYEDLRDRLSELARKLDSLPPDKRDKLRNPRHVELRAVDTPQDDTVPVPAFEREMVNRRLREQLPPNPRREPGEDDSMNGPLGDSSDADSDADNTLHHSRASAPSITRRRSEGRGRMWRRQQSSFGIFK